jgi:hypothetical protein
VEATLHPTPPDATHWSTQTLAHAQGISHVSAARIREAHCLQPHRIETFKLIGTCYLCHRHEEFLKFLRTIDRDTSPGQAIQTVDEILKKIVHGKAVIGTPLGPWFIASTTTSRMNFF